MSDTMLVKLEQRRSAVSRAENIFSTATEQDRDLTDAERNELDLLLGSVCTLTGEIQATETFERQLAACAETTPATTR